MKFILIFIILLHNFFCNETQTDESMTKANNVYSSIEFISSTMNNISSSSDAISSTINSPDHCCSKNCKILQEESTIDCTFCNCDCVPQMPTFAMIIKLSYNAIANLSANAFAAYKNLRRLELEHNRISEIDAAAFFNCTARLLNLNSNKISRLPDFLFTHMKYLKILYLNYNLLDSLNTNAFDNDNLRNLYLYNNKFNQAPIFYVGNRSIFKNLEVLNMEGNYMTKIDSNFFKGIERINTLNCVNNKIATISDNSLKTLKNLKYLWIQKNSLSKITSNSFASHSLIYLSAYKTGLVFKKNYNYFSNIPNLKNLEISETKISSSRIEEYQSFPLSNLSNLETLLLRNNHLTEEKLRYLLKDLTKLQHLDISQNMIEFLSADFFLGLIKTLRQLILTSNKLTVVNSSMFPYEMWHGQAPMQQLDFYNNPFQCDCKVLWLRRWLRSNYSQITKSHKYICDTPANFRGTKVIDLLTPTEAECLQEKSVKIIIFCCLICALYIVSAITALIHRYRWHARYALFIYRIRNKNRTEVIEREYHYDAFVSYCWSDRKWIVENLAQFEIDNQVKFCFHDRDWNAGKFILDNIFESMASSRKVLIVVSNAYAASHWCQIELTLVQTRLFELDNDNIIILLMEDLREENVSPRLLLQLQKKTYIRWPRCNEIGEEEGIKLFWMHLKRSLECKPKPSTNVTNEEIIGIMHMQ